MIDGSIAALLEPLERFETLRRKAVRLGSRLCDLAYANPYGGAQSAARAAIAETLAEDRSLDLQYTPFGGHTIVRRVVADALRSEFGLDATYRDVVLTPGAMAALHVALRASAEPGAEVIVPAPCWLDHPLYVRACGLTAVLVPLSGPSYDLDVDAVAAVVTPRTRAVVLSHPANPTGRIYDEGVLRKLGDALGEAERTGGTRITLVSDETHRDFSEPGRFVSAAACVQRSLVVYSFGKYHFLQGQRIGYVAVGPDHPERGAIAEELVRWTRILGVATPTALMQRAVPRLLALRYDQGWLTAWRERYVAALTGFGYEVVPPDGTLFLYVATPRGEDDLAFVERLAAMGVLALPASVFHHSGAFRLALTGSEDMLERALPILEEAA